MGPMGLQDDEWCDEGKGTCEGLSKGKDQGKDQGKDLGKDQGKDRACPHSAACILLATRV